MSSDNSLGAFVAGIMITIVSFAIAGDVKKLVTSPPAPHYTIEVVSEDEYLYETAKRDYQVGLNTAGNKIPNGLIGFKDSLLYLGIPSEGLWSCSHRCATATRLSDGTYEVALPAGFTHDPENSLWFDEELFTTATISKLTFWNPEQHKLDTVQVDKGLESVSLPSELTARRIGDLEVGQLGFIAPTYIIQASDGTLTVATFTDLTLELADPLYISSSDYQNVPVVRTHEGYVVCMNNRAPALYTDKSMEDVIPLFHGDC